MGQLPGIVDGEELRGGAAEQHPGPDLAARRRRQAAEITEVDRARR